MFNKLFLNTILLTMLVSLTMILSTKIATAGVLNNIKIDIKSIQTGNNTAIAHNNAGSYNKIMAYAGLTNINIKNTNLNTQLNIIHKGNNTAEAINKGGSHNNIIASASVVSLNVYR